MPLDLNLQALKTVLYIVVKLKIMKKLLLLLFLIPLVSFGQKIKSVESFDVSSIKNKKEWKKYKNGFDTNELKVEFGVFKVGSELILGNPSDSEMSSDFKFVAVNKFSIMGAMAPVFFNNSDSNLEILIERIRVYRPAMGQPMKLIIDFKSILNFATFNL